jgi:TfoX/Sxy family transcriptional regulator of competence genes
MSTSTDFIDFVIEQIAGVGDIRYRKMFGEFMVYVNDKPILLICDNTVFVKMHEQISDLMKTAQKGFPYQGAKQHYILDIDDRNLATQVIKILEPITPFPKSRRK